ncbi:MAG: ComEC/Rec2 family competence protein [Patescibacteria group bacterium]|jgi:beta-lactamase superfamily II metal-dependent hydrolase
MSFQKKVFGVFSGIAVVLTAVFLFWAVYLHGNGGLVLGEKLAGQGVQKSASSADKSADKLEVDFLDVGQGDAELIRAPGGQNILIDGGPNARVIERLSDVLPPWDSQIDLMVLTHPHDDHVTGLIEVIKRYEVKKILYTGVSHTSPNYLAWLEIVRDKKIPLMIIDRPQSVLLADGKDGGDENREGARLEILFPLESFLGKEAENLNNTSIVMRLVYGNTSFLFTGDAEEPEEKEMLEEGIDLSADVLKVGHHGSETATGEEFLKTVKPEMAVIEVGADNSFGHPSLRVLKRLDRVKAKIFRTDEEGSVRLVSDGEEISVKN